MDCTNFLKKENCLNTIRLMAALSVMYGHLTSHLNVQFPQIFNIIFTYFSGVPIFFMLSGYLIWDSIERSRSFSLYLKKRFFRIYPELWCSIVLEVITILFFYKIDDVFYFILFIFCQSSIFQFWTPNFLRGYGCGTPNGSLWTIGILIQFYIIIYFIKKKLHNKGYYTWLFIFLLTLILGLIPNMLDNYIPNILIKLYGQTVFNYLYLFIAGAFLCEFKEVLNYVKKYWYVFTVFGILAYILNDQLYVGGYPLFKCIFSIYGLIGFAYSFPKFNINPDISYGLYVYHMIVVNVMIQLNLINDKKYYFIALFISFVLAYFSTKSIGKWSLSKKMQQ